MNESFDVEVVLHEVLEVLRRHNIPVETASLNVSLLDAAFDEHIPQLKSYKAGHFHRPIVIDNVPLLFQAQRRYPFDEIVQVLDHELMPPIEAFAEDLQQEYPALKIEIVTKSATQSPDSPHLLDLHSYRLGVDCQFSDDIHADYNEIDLAIFLQQREATAYPGLSAWVGWLVDEESGGDWGVDTVYTSTIEGLDYAPHRLDLLQTALPSYFKSFRKEIVRKLSGELTQAR